MAARAAHSQGSDSAEGGAREICSVERWRGYVYSTFCARHADGGAIIESAPFRWRGSAPPPDEGAPRRAHDSLTAELEALGWSLESAAGEPWYATRFVRPLEETEGAPPPKAAPAAAASPPPVARPVSPQVAPQPAGGPPPNPSRPTAESPAKRRTRRRFGAGVYGVALAAGGALGAAYLMHSGAGGPATAAASPPVHQRAAPTPKAVVPAAQVAAPVRAAARPIVHVSISATDRSSWLQVRRRSAHGPLLYSGQLAAGQRVRFHGTRIWALFGAAGNLKIVADGKLVVLNGTFEHVFAAK